MSRTLSNKELAVTVIRHGVGIALNSSNYRVLPINPPVCVFELWYDRPNFGCVGLAYFQIECLEILAYARVFLYNRRLVDFAKFVSNS